MFTWYRQSAFCFAYLADVDVGPDSQAPFNKSRWFTRGWTLQKLIAPETVYFFDRSWKYLEDKRHLQKEITKITGIDAEVFYSPRSLFTKSVARRMSWASERQTTRIEDVAYCLLGIFNIDMAMLYGEGDKVFLRLQQEIMRSTYDHSLFAWSFCEPLQYSGPNPSIGVGLLAPHPMMFRKSANVIPIKEKSDPCEVANRGLRMHIHLIRHFPSEANRNKPYYATHLAILRCGFTQNLCAALAIPVIKYLHPMVRSFAGAPMINASKSTTRLL